MKGEKIIMTTVKITKRERYESIKALVEAVGPVEGIDTEGIVAFCDKEIAALATRAEKAKEKAAEKRAEGDELQAAVLAALTDEPATRQEITDRIEGEGVSVAKVGYRLTQLVENEQAVKEDLVITGEDSKSKKVAGYRLA